MSVIAATRPVQSLLIAIFVLMLGTGFLSTLISLRLERQGVDTLAIGAVATSYFGGLVLGAQRAGRVVRRVGHIRAFAAFVALMSASTLSYGLVQHPLFWGALRLIDGLCMAGVFICLESWLNERADSAYRGSVLAAYMVALYSGQAIGQMLLATSDLVSRVPFEIASILISLAIIPLCLTRSSAPAATEASAFSIRALFVASPLAAIGSVTTGLMLGAFYGMAAVHVRRLGLELSETAAFMMVVILGGVLMQWPLGRLSDRYDRRCVIILCFAATLIISLAISFLAAPGYLLFFLGWLFGGLSFALYPLCVAQANDRLMITELVAASGRLVLLYSIGAAFGPMCGAAFMMLAGGPGLFLFIALCAGLTVAFGLWRQTVTPPVPETVQQDFQIVPRTTPMASLLDPHTPDTPDAPGPDPDPPLAGQMK